VIAWHDFHEFEAVENADGFSVLGGVEAEAGIAFVGGEDELVGVVRFHETRSLRWREI
jgi:hypothetical protein